MCKNKNLFKENVLHIQQKGPCFWLQCQAFALHYWSNTPLSVVGSHERPYYNLSVCFDSRRPIQTYFADIFCCCLHKQMYYKLQKLFSQITTSITDVTLGQKGNPKQRRSRTSQPLHFMFITFKKLNLVVNEVFFDIKLFKILFIYHLPSLNTLLENIIGNIQIMPL